MKKLTGVMLAIAITTSTATTTIGCNNLSSNFSSLEVRTVISSTTDLSSIMLMQKSENLGLNVADPLSEKSWETNSGYGKGILDRFKSAISYGKDKYSVNKTKRYSQWSNVFDSESNGSDIIDDLKVNNFIKEDSLSPDFNKLGYLLSDDDRNAKYNLNTSYFQPNDMGTDENKLYSARLKSNLDQFNNSSTGALDVLTHPSKNGVNTFLSALNNFIAISETDPDAAPSGVMSWYGQVYKMLIGKMDDPWPANFNTEDLNGDTVGYITAIYELVYNEARKNKSKYVKYLNDDVYNLLFGNSTTVDKSGNYRLIANVDGGFARKREDIGAGKIGNGQEKIKFFEAIPNTGLFGDLINLIGNIKMHTKENINAEKSMNVEDRYINAPSNDRFDYTEVVLTDKDVVEIFKKTRELFEITRQKLPEDVLAQLFKVTTNKIPFLVKAALIGFGINADKYMFNLVDLIFSVMDGFIRFNAPEKGLQVMDAKDITSYFDNLNTFDTSNIRRLREAVADIKSANIFDNANSNYRDDLYRILGVNQDGKGEDAWIKNCAYSNIYYGIKNNAYGDLLGQIKPNNSEQVLNDMIDKPLIEGFKIEDTKSIKVEYNVDSSIKSITYDLIYNGVGNSDVQKFKVDNYGKYDADEILEKLKNKDKDFIDNYLGNNTIESVKKNVLNKYRVVWVNEATVSNSVDMKLADITSSQAYVNGVWKNMLI